ncbi:MAG: helix-turn-helix domain-containing protein [Acidobacteriia bacterium]|nr:helix-turn-helix domain-containing protein [Terriglobia bacterium]
MGSFGERLQREREMRGITLEEIAEATKIGTRSLRALEEQDFDRLPGGIFNKGFVRAYSRYLGLDEEQAVADYLAALTEAQAAGKVTRQEPTASGAAPDRNIFIGEDDYSEPLRLPLIPIALLVLIAVLLYGGWRYYTQHGLPNLRHVRAAGQQPSQPASKAAPPAARPDTAVALPAATRAQPAGGFVVRVKAKEDTWVSLVADDKPVMSGMLQAGDEKSVHAQRSVVLKTGNAAGVELFHNDKMVPTLGASKEVKTVEFTAAGLRQ